jgi:hypothetical protein
MLNCCASRCSLNLAEIVALRDEYSDEETEGFGVWMFEYGEGLARASVWLNETINLRRSLFRFFSDFQFCQSGL